MEEVEAYRPGCVRCIRSDQSPREERETRQCVGQCNIEPFDLQELGNYVHSRKLFHKTRSQRSFKACNLGAAILPAMVAGGWATIIRGIPCDSEWWAPSV